MKHKKITKNQSKNTKHTATVLSFCLKNAALNNW